MKMLNVLSYQAVNFHINFKGWANILPDIWKTQSMNLGFNVHLRHNTDEITGLKGCVAVTLPRYNMWTHLFVHWLRQSVYAENLWSKTNDITTTKHVMMCILQSDRSRERDCVSILSVSSCGQRGGDDVAGAVTDQDEEVVTWPTWTGT